MKQLTQNLADNPSLRSNLNVLLWFTICTFTALIVAGHYAVLTVRAAGEGFGSNPEAMFTQAQLWFGAGVLCGGITTMLAVRVAIDLLDPLLHRHPPRHVA